MCRNVANGKTKASVVGGVAARRMDQVSVMQGHLSGSYRNEGALGVVKAITDALAPPNHVHGFGLVIVLKDPPLMAAWQDLHASRRNAGIAEGHPSCHMQMW